METNEKRKILIVEDDKSLARALSIKLTNVGFLVTVSHSGEEALATYEDNAFDLILLDLMMPKIDGFSVLEKLQSLENTTPILVASNLGQQSDIDEATRLGAAGYVVKSNNSLGMMVTEIQKYLTA